MGSLLFADSNLAYLDMDTIISKSKSGSHMFKQLDEIRQKDIEKFIKSEEIFKSIEKDLLSKKNIISKEEFNLKVKNLKNDINEYRVEKNNTIQRLNRKRVDNSNYFLKLINPILITYSKENAIDVILQKKNIIIGQFELDITDKILEIVNKNIKNFEFK